MASDISTLLLLSVSDVEQVVAKLQELQCSISAVHPEDPAKDTSSRVVNLPRNTVSRKPAAEEPSPAKWSQWSTAAKQVHEVISEISMASQFAKQIAKKVFAGSVQDNLQKGFEDSFQTVNRPLPFMVSAVYSNDAASKSPETAQKPEMMTTAFVDLSSEKTPVPIAPLLSTKTAAAKRNVAKPPHLFKVVLGSNNSLGAKSGSVAGSCQSLEAHKIAPSPLLPESIRSGTLAGKPQTPKHVAALVSSCRRSYPSHMAVRRSMEKKVKLRHSSELGRDGRTVRLCKLSTEGTAPKKQVTEVPGRADVDSKCGDNEVISTLVNPISLPPLVPLSAVKVESSTRRTKKWLPQQFSKAKPETAKTTVRHKTRTPSKPLPALITKLPSRKMDTTTTTAAAAAAAVPSAAQSLPDPANMKMSCSKTVLPLLPLPPARQAAERKRIAAEAVTKSSSVVAVNVQDVSSSSFKSVSDSRISLHDGKLLEEAGSDILLTKSREQQEKNVEVKDSAANLTSACSSMDLRRRGVGEAMELPPVGVVVPLPRTRSGVGKENKHDSSLERSSSVGNQQQKSGKPLTAASGGTSSGKSLLTRAKSWMSLQSVKDHDNGRRGGRGEVHGCLSSSSSAHNAVLTK